MATPAMRSERKRRIAIRVARRAAKAGKTEALTRRTRRRAHGPKRRQGFPDREDHPSWVAAAIAALQRLGCLGGAVYLTAQDLADEMGTSRRTARRTIDYLEYLGEIRVTQASGGVPRIRLRPGGDRRPRRYRRLPKRDGEYSGHRVHAAPLDVERNSATSAGRDTAAEPHQERAEAAQWTPCPRRNPHREPNGAEFPAPLKPRIPSHVEHEREGGPSGGLPSLSSGQDEHPQSSPPVGASAGQPTEEPATPYVRHPALVAYFESEAERKKAEAAEKRRALQELDAKIFRGAAEPSAEPPPIDPAAVPADQRWALELDDEEGASVADEPEEPASE